jgi:hypothetical protein
MAMYKAHVWFEGSSLDVASLNVPNAYSIGTPNSNTYRNTIHITTSTIYPTSINGQNLIRRITNAKNENIDRWFKANPDTFGEISARFNSNTNTLFPPNGGPAPVQPIPTVIQETCSDRIAATNIHRACSTMQLMLA